MFNTAPVIPAPARKSRKCEPRYVEMQGLKKLAEIRRAIAQLEAIHDAIEADLKSAAEIEFINAGRKAKARPANFRIQEENATGSCDLAARAKTRPLAASEIEALAQAGIPTVTVTDRPETYVINPAYKDDTQLLEKVNRKLRRVPGVPKDFFLKQESVSRIIPDSSALDRLFQLDGKTIRKLLPILATISIRNVEIDEDPAINVVGNA